MIKSGLTETFSVSSVDPDIKVARVGSAGMILPGIEAKIVKPDGTLGKEGEKGELLIRGPCLATGYLNNPEAYVMRVVRSIPRLTVLQQCYNLHRRLVLHRR